jgi:hypothetical protein
MRPGLRLAVSFSLLAGALAALMPSGSVAANLVFHSHGTSSATFTDIVCGVPGTSVQNAMENIQVFADGRFQEEFNVNQIFTATASGKSIQIFAAARVSGNFHATVHDDGTFTFTNANMGLNEKLKIPNGPTLSTDAGTVTIADTFAATPPYNLISETLSSENGPHPDLDSGFAVFCNVIGPVLA